MTEPLVSIIVPNYNHSQFLQQRLDSIFTQSYQDFEVILLDDCSTDTSVEILNNYKNHPKVSHIVINETNSGSTFKQWKKGVSLAKGAYIWIAESDDWCEPSMLEELIKGISENEQTVMAFCGTYVVSIDGHILQEVGGQKPREIFNGNDFIRLHLANRNSILNSSMRIFKREAFNAIEYDLGSMRYCGDWMSNIYLAVQGDVFQLGKCLNYFRQPGADIAWRSHNFGRYYKEVILVLLELKRMKIFIPKNIQGLILEKLLMLEDDNRVKGKELKKVRHAIMGELTIYNKIRYTFFTRPKHTIIKK
jgi:glycosyltransferase involved in cell wall biosynthesis